MTKNAVRDHLILATVKPAIDKAANREDANNSDSEEFYSVS